jgi:hypothetical protein
MERQILADPRSIPLAAIVSVNSELLRTREAFPEKAGAGAAEREGNEAQSEETFSCRGAAAAARSPDGARCGLSPRRGAIVVDIAFSSRPRSGWLRARQISRFSIAVVGQALPRSASLGAAAATKVRPRLGVEPGLAERYAARAAAQPEPRRSKWPRHYDGPRARHDPEAPTLELLKERPEGRAKRGATATCRL